MSIKELMPPGATAIVETIPAGGRECPTVYYLSSTGELACPTPGICQRPPIILFDNGAMQPVCAHFNKSNGYCITGPRPKDSKYEEGPCLFASGYKKP